MAAEEGRVISCHSYKDLEQQLQKARESNKLAVIDLTAPAWCGPCRSIDPIYDEIAKKTPHVVFLRVDVDDQEIISQKFNVRALPTFVFVKEGEEVDRVVGAEEEKLRAKIAQYGA